MASFLDRVDPALMFQLSAGLLGGKTAAEQSSGAMTGLSNYYTTQRADQKALAKTNKTLEYLRSVSPELAAQVDAGLPAADAFKMYNDQRLKAQMPKKRNLMEVGGAIYDQDTNQWIQPPEGVGKKDPYLERQKAADQFGMKPDDPARQSYILTGKMPREDQAPLTATDKKAILEADEMVAANENALTALDQAMKVSPSANEGLGAKTRGAMGNMLPDMMVPDFVSSPESSAATAEYDNLVIGQALSSLKSTFGAAPTEGERKILLELQGSSNLPHEVRMSILQRAKGLAERRLEFNRKRAEELRGGSFYKAGGGTSTQPAQGNRTSGGVSWSREN